ncbi:MAG TPA: alpha/beta fold hydrolase [Kiritimatiellia bacterium]|jgi:hypothetical protein
MPILESTYRPPFGFSNGHVQTLLAPLWRPVPHVAYTRERIDTPDGDFLDLDWCRYGLNRIAIVSAGMEGNSTRAYVAGMVRALNAAAWDAVAWNYRGCSGEPNRKLHFYNGGMVEDVQAVVDACLRAGYRTIALVGFSLGGNLLLNYLGRLGKDVGPEIAAAVAISAPIDVADCADQLNRTAGRLYTKLFLRSFRKKIREKMKLMPDKLTDEGYEQIKTLQEYDVRYSCPHFGFATYPEFYKAVSSRFVIDRVARPTLVVNARNDPFMGEHCFPVEQAKNNPNLHLEMPATGGHIGFVTLPRDGAWWTERRAVEFLCNL